jgi:hypothetical protein
VVLVARFAPASETVIMALLVAPHHLAHCFLHMAVLLGRAVRNLLVLGLAVMVVAY